MNRERRRLLLAGLGACWPLPVFAQKPASARVIVIGGGFGGASCARLLRGLDPSLCVSLIEPRAHFFTGPSSNAALASVCAEGDIVRGPGALVREGVQWIAQRAVSVDPILHEVRTADGQRHRADYLVLSPGVTMRWGHIEGLNASNSAQMPHAWLGDEQLGLLRRRIEALPDGATLAISAPANPYRCPPGPYERASLLAWRLAQTGRARCKILLLDAKDDFSKRDLFQLGWDTLYPGRIEWVSRARGGEVLAVDTARGEVHLQSGERLRPDLVCAIPPQRAADVARQADLVDESGWCPVHPANFESTLHAGIHVIGDAAAAQPMPKSAFSANSQGKLVALAIHAAVRGLAAPEPRLVNTCYSLLAPDYAISVGGLYGVVSGRLSTLNDGMSPLGAARELRAREAAYARDWYRGITEDSFGPDLS